MAAGELGLDGFAEVLFGAVQVEGGEKFAVGQVPDTFLLTLNTDELLNVGVPGGNVLVADGPVDGHAVFGVRLEVVVAPPVTVAAPHDGTAADVVTADPVKTLVLVVVEFIVLVDPVQIILLYPPVEAVLLVIVAGDLFAGHLALKFQVPGIERRGGVVPVLHHPAALEHERLVAFFAEFHGGVAARDAAAYNDGVVGDFVFSLRVEIHDRYPFVGGR